MKILGYNYEVLQSGDSDFLAAMGRCHTRTQIIHIATNQNNEQKVSTMLHEIIEALNYHLELNLEHSAIMSLEAGLYQVLNDSGINLSPLLEDR